MAFSGPVWECESGGDDTNFGGGFDTGVAGFPTDGAATSANTSAPAFTSASYNFVAGDVGAWIFIKSGTNWTPGWYKIASVASNAATLSAAIGSATLFNLCASSVIGCATTASPTGATWGIDYSISTTSRITFTDMIIDATTNTKFTSALKPVGVNYIGNVISVTSGTGFTVQRIAIVSISGVIATCDKSLGTLSSTLGNGQLGGCFATPGAMGALMAGFNGAAAFVKQATYQFTTNTANTAGGPMSPAIGFVIGYSTNRYLGNADTRPIFQNNGSTITTFQTSSNTDYVNIAGDGNGQTAARLCNTSCLFTYCTFTGYNTVGTNGSCEGCLATANSIGIFSGGTNSSCEAYANTATPFNTGSCNDCLSYSNTGANTDGFGPFINNGQVNRCISALNGRDGFRSNVQLTLSNCHSEQNGGFGYNINMGSGAFFLKNCSHWNNTSGALGGRYTTGPTSAPYFNFTALTGSAINSSTDLSLNNLAGQGAVLRANAYQGFVKNLMPRGLTATYLDCGPAQHADPIAVCYQSTMLGGLDG